MDMRAATEAAIEAGGGIRPLARQLTLSGMKVGPASVQQWKRDGRIPATRVLAVEAAIDSCVTRYELRPDVYGAP